VREYSPAPGVTCFERTGEAAGTLEAFKRECEREGIAHVLTAHIVPGETQFQYSGPVSTAGREALAKSVTVDLLRDGRVSVNEVVCGQTLGSTSTMTVKQVAAMLQKSEAWVRRHANQLGVIRLGSGRGADVLFSRHALEGFLRRHSRPERAALERIVS